MTKTNANRLFFFLHYRSVDSTWIISWLGFDTALKKRIKLEELKTLVYNAQFHGITVFFKYIVVFLHVYIVRLCVSFYPMTGSNGYSVTSSLWPISFMFRSCCRSSILSEVSTRSSSKLPTGKNIIVFGVYYMSPELPKSVLAQCFLCVSGGC